ncbi:MAG: FkbM family methyltransferase, partial [Patescibacteria group bacterium]
MINFSKISNKSIIGKLLRLFLKIIPNNTILPIFQGRLKWKRWIRGSGMDSYWLGNYELEKVVSFEENIKKGDVIFDIGAQSGFYTLLASELTGEDGKVFSF